MIAALSKLSSQVKAVEPIRLEKHKKVSSIVCMQSIVLC